MSSQSLMLPMLCSANEKGAKKQSDFSQNASVVYDFRFSENKENGMFLLICT